MCQLFHLLMGGRGLLRPTAPHVFLLASLARTATALAATFLPAARAGRVDPMLALRA